jgi:3-dehydroquinate synthase
VVVDLETLDTLPPRELAAGLAEVIKIGAVADAGFLARVEQDLAELSGRDPAALAAAVARACELKAEIVAADEREEGRRAILNFGHTFGHAIEAAAGYGTWLHGEAVGCGMAMAADLSARLGLVGRAEADRIQRLVADAGLPTAPPAIDADRWLSLVRGDKKAAGGEARFVLLEGVGRATVRPVPSTPLLETLSAFGAV